MVSHFSLIAFEILVLSLAFESLIVICLSEAFFECAVWSWLRFLGLYVDIFHQIWAVLAIISSNTFS